jgi:glutathione S-transferase
VDSWYAHWVRQGFDAIERMLEPGPFAFGSRPTLADVYLVPQVFNARRFNVPLEPYSRIAAVDEACATLEAFQAAAPDRQPDAA